MLSRAIFLLTLLVIFFLFFLPVKDTDFGWHYRCGHEVLNGNTSCLNQNTYTYYLDGYKWAYPRLFYDTSLSITFDHFGFIGVSILGAVMMAIAFSLVLFSFSGPLILRILLVFISIFGGWSIYSLGYRSQIVSVFFLAVEIFILKKSVRNQKLLWLLPIFFAIWANTHPAFFLGPLIFGLFLAVGKKSPKNIVIFIISCFATLINPYGWRIYEEVLRHLYTPLNTLIAEWVAPETNQIMVILASICLLIFLTIRRKAMPGYLFILTIIFGYMAITARRNLPLFYFVFPLSLLETFPKFSLDKSVDDLLKIMATSLLPVICLFLLPNFNQAIGFDTNNIIYCETGLTPLPCKAFEYFRNKKGNVFNTYEWGGSLIWKLPNMKFFVDGRMPAWPTENNKSPYTVFLEILQAHPGWNETLQKYNTDYIFIAPETFLDLALDKNKGLEFGWQEEYRDRTAVIYKKM